MFSFDARALSAELSAVIEAGVSADAWQWLKAKTQEIATAHDGSALNLTFSAIPRKMGKHTISLNAQQAGRISSLRKGLSIDGWSVDRLCRVWVLMQTPSDSLAEYKKNIGNLFLAAEMNELVALYSALPVLAFPEAWKSQCAEGIRSNIGDVLEAIMCNNPYPSEQLDEAAWNQLVLKAIFTEKPLHQVIGLDKRANPELANTLSDFAHERWAAHRTVPPMLWRCVGPFVNNKTFGDLERLMLSVDTTEREAAALACSMSAYPEAKDLLQRNSQLAEAVAAGEITWEILAKKTELV